MPPPGAAAFSAGQRKPSRREPRCSRRLLSPSARWPTGGGGSRPTQLSPALAALRVPGISSQVKHTKRTLQKWQKTTKGTPGTPAPRALSRVNRPGLGPKHPSRASRTREPTPRDRRPRPPPPIRNGGLNETLCILHIATALAGCALNRIVGPHRCLVHMPQRGHAPRPRLARHAPPRVRPLAYLAQPSDSSLFFSPSDSSDKPFVCMPHLAAPNDSTNMSPVFGAPESL